MTIINTGENQIKWTVRKGLSSVNEDFTRSDVMLFAISQTNKIPLPITSKEKGVIVATIPHVVPATQEHPEYGHRGIQEDTYDVELVWIKNKRELNRTYLHNAFRVSDNPLIQTLTVEIVSTAQSYGYDGLSAYEIAMFRRLSEGESAICENEWLEDLLAEKANTTDLNAEIANRLNADSTLSSRIDSEITDRQEEDIKLSNRIQAEVNARSLFDNEILDQINDINYKIPEGASDTNKLTDKQYVDNQMAQKANISYVDDNFATKQALNLETYEREHIDDFLNNKIDGVSTRVGTVERLIPTEADPNNMLADKEFVNSSVSTNTATFKGSYNLVTDLGLSADATNAEIAQALLVATSSCDNNDYCFTAVPVSNRTPTTIKEVRRFKYNETNNSWVYEYTLNNSGFTAAQWAAILSGITSVLVNKLATLPTNDLLTSQFNEKQDVLVSGSNIKSINGKSVLGSGNLEIKDILLVLYNSTSYNDIAQAYISGKMVFSLDLPNGRLYTLTSITNDGATFTSFDCDAHSFHSFVVNSSNVYSAVVTTPIQEELAFDNDPTLNSTNPVTSDGIKRAEDELLLRVQGKSLHYIGDLDPILRKSYPINAPEGVDTYKYAIKQANDFLNGEYFAMNNGKYYRGQENGVPREIDVTELRTICRNLVHIDITGGCLWVMNMPLAFATGRFRQIAFGAEPYSSTEAGYEVTGGIRPGKYVLQRMSTYDFNTGIVTWSEWKEIISDLDSIRTAASGALQKSGGSMTGDLDLNSNALLVSKPNGQNRYGIRFAGAGTSREGVYVGNPNMRLFLEADPNLDLIHKKGNDYHTILDAGNVKTINGTSLLGSGDISFPDVSEFITKSVNDLTYYTTSSDLETALSGKLSTLTFDNTPTLNSNNPVTSNGVKSADNEVLLRMLGKSEHYNGYDDPILRKEFVGNSELDSEIRRKETLQRVNNYLDQLYYAIINGLCYRGFDDGQPKPLSDADRLAISHGLIHMDILGGCIWVINAPYNFSTGSFRQIAVGAQNYSYSAQEGDAIDVTVTNGIEIGNKVLQRLSTYNTSTGEVTWTNWSELIDVSRYITSQQLTTALLQFALSVLGALDGKQDTISDLATIRSNASGAVQKSGDTMQGSLVLGIGASSSNKLKFNDDRDFARFSSNAFIVGDPNILLKLETGNVDLKHRYTENNSTSEYAMLDERNTKTINSSSLYGSGDLLLYTVSDVKANLEAMFTALVSAGVIQNYTLTDPASGSKTFGFSFT